MHKEIPDFPDYFVDTDGNVYSMKPVNQNSPRPIVPKKFKKRLRGDYNFVGLRKDGLIYQVNVGVLVLSTFVSPRPNGMVVCHGEKGRLDDSLANLSWNSHKHNCLVDKLRDGTMANGIKNGNHTLTEEAVRKIRSEYCRNGIGGPGAKKLSQKYNVNLSTIQRIVKRQTWKHI